MAFLLMLLAGTTIIARAQKAGALAGSSFNAARIIDDTVFYNSASMGADQIQQFLDAKVPNCDTNGTQAYGGTTRAAYGTSKGYPPPYICLKDYSQTVPAVVGGGSELCTGSISSGTKMASQIIYDVAQACGVNPQVILVLLQKEQSLVTDDWPWPNQYRSATGYGCPDTAPCDSQYYGFFNQVYQAAKAYRRYRANPSNYNYRAGRNNTILWHPNSACGSSSVYIENQATAGLYIYTPYRPNQAALNNLYGSGDSCSSYGNRNFWRMFNDWFGATLGDRPVSNANWNFENLEGGTTGLKPSANTVGQTPETISYANNLYVFYYDATSQVLKMALAGSNGWSYQTLDGDSTSGGKIIANVGLATTATIYNNMLHIFYYDATNASMRHAWYIAGGSWQFETLDGSATSVSGTQANVGMSNSATEFAGDLHVFYYDASNHNLRHANFNSSNGWNFRNLDGDYGSIAGSNGDIGQNPDATVVGNTLQLFYYDVSNGNLRHAWADPGQPWKFENLDGDPGSIARFNSNVGTMAKALSFKNSLYVFYRDSNSGVIRYAWADSGGWHFAPLDGAPFSVSGYRSNTGFSPTPTGYGDSLQLYYFDNDQRALRHAFGTPYW